MFTKYCFTASTAVFGHQFVLASTLVFLSVWHEREMLPENSGRTCVPLAKGRRQIVGRTLKDR